MSLSNCKQCGKLFKKERSAFCMPCEETRNQTFHDIYQYIQSHPGIGISEISRRFQISASEAERIVYSPEMGTAQLMVQSQCTLCKKNINPYERSGKFCMDCSQQMKTDIREEQRHIEEKQQKMRPTGTFTGVNTDQTSRASSSRRGSYGLHRTPH